VRVRLTNLTLGAESPGPGVHQAVIAAYREPDRAKARAKMATLIESVSRGVPAALSEVITLGRTLKKRAGDLLAYFGRPGTSSAPTGAINGRLEHLRGSALGFRNLTHYIARSLLETGGFRPQLHPRLRTAAVHGAQRALHWHIPSAPEQRETPWTSCRTS